MAQGQFDSVLHLHKEWLRLDKYGGRAVLIGADLPSAVLSDVGLSSANLVAACLLNANLYGINLESALPHEADLPKADLRRAILNVADLSHMKAWYTNFKGCRIDLRKLHWLLGCEMP